jgi:hypothetical protein
MGITLFQILDLVGKLDDSSGEDVPRERFRRFLQENTKEVGQIRDYIEEALRSTSDQSNRALQDLVNYLGRFLEFEVRFGRYRGVHGEIGFDGHWISQSGNHIVVEVKTTETYTINTSTLVGYIDELISSRQIPNWESAMGLYVIGRPDPETRQLENAIRAEHRTHQLRIMSVNSLLSMAEMMNEYDVSHDDILSVILPPGPSVDPIVDLMARLVAQSQTEERVERAVVEEFEPEGEPAYWLTPVSSDEEATAEEVIQRLVEKEQIYAFGERTPGRKHIKPGDWICFYASGKGVVAHARVTSRPEELVHPAVRHPDRYRWVFHLDNPHLYLDAPVVIDTGLRERLEAFEGRDPTKPWAWFVQATNKISEHDFDTLTRRSY